MNRQSLEVQFAISSAIWCGTEPKKRINEGRGNFHKLLWFLVSTYFDLFRRSAGIFTVWRFLF